MLRYLLSLLTILLLFSCTESEEIKISEGIWLAELDVTASEVLPFNFSLKKDDTGKFEMEIYNADEIILVDEIEINNDSIIIKAPVFEGYIAGTFDKDLIEGNFIKESLDRIVPFKAYHGKTERFDKTNTHTSDVTGIWKTEFSPNTKDSYMAKGIFEQKEGKVTGTFRTTTGDYRYLEGVMDGDSLKLSAFDGAHAFLFTAKVTDSTIAGTFYSGNHFQEPFIGIRDEKFELPDAESLTYLKEGYEKFEFSFPDEEGNLISLTDDKFKDKVVLVQIMGTWCPNCLDETKFYIDYLNNKGNQELEVVALAFEYAKTEKAAFNSIKRLKQRIEVPYPILLAQYGTSDKQEAQKKLPMLNHVLSYPTTIYIDKKGEVRKIHTGFNGPATGDKYIEFKKNFDDFVQELLSE